MSSKKPKKAPFNNLKIGYGTFKINHLTDKDASRRLIDGEYHSKEQEIDYDSSMHPEAQLHALLHEAGHGIVDVYGLLVKLASDDEEEKFVRAFCGGLLSFFKDNKQFYDWMGEILYDEEEE